MAGSKIAKRYAQGLLDFCKDSNQTEVVYSEMNKLAKIMSASKDQNRFFQMPYIHFKRKLSVAAEVFKSFSQVSQNMINLIIKHGREAHISDIAEDFISKVDEENGVQKITLTTATELSPNIIEDILNLSSIVNREVKNNLTTIIKPDILGGYILRVGDKQMDESVRSKLNQVKKEFQLN